MRYMHRTTTRFYDEKKRTSVNSLRITKPEIESDERAKQFGRIIFDEKISVKNQKVFLLFN